MSNTVPLKPLPEMRVVHKGPLVHLANESITLNGDRSRCSVSLDEVVEHGTLTDKLLFALVMLQADGVRQARAALERNTPEAIMAHAAGLFQQLGILKPPAEAPVEE